VSVPSCIAHRFTLVAIALIVMSSVPSTSTARPNQPDVRFSDSQSRVFLPIIARAREPLGFVTTPAELQTTKIWADQGIEPSHKSVVTLLRTANAALLVAPCAVANYTTVTGSGCLNQSAQYAYVLAMTYRMTNDPRYGYQSAAIIRTWIATLVTIDGQDSQTWLDWSRWGAALIWAADLLEGTPAWNDDDRRQFTTMLVGKLLDLGRTAGQRTNNWADAGTVLWLSIALYAKLPAEHAAAIANWKLKLDGVYQLDGSWLHGMAVDGSLPDENMRDLSGLGYNQVALSAKTVFAEILGRQGDGSLYLYTSPRGVGLKNGWDFLAQQVVNANAGLCTWPYTANHCVTYANKSGWEIAFAYWHAPAYLGPIQLKRPYQWSDWADPGYSTLLFANLNLDN
jgi:hypothetical protein